MKNETKFNFIVFKKSITEYRVQDLKTGKITDVGSNLVLSNVYPFVLIDKYNEAKKANFKNSGLKNDYFAGLICESYELKKEPNVFHRISKKLVYNPFRSVWFFDRDTNKTFRQWNKFKFVLIENSTLKYI